MFINPLRIFIFTLLAQNIWSLKTIRSKDDNCVVKHNGQILTEGDVIDVKGKFYKVEDCGLHRAYHACGTHIIFIINIVCQAIEQHKLTPTKKRFTRFVQQKLLTEACCQNLCTVSEMTRYCPQ
jgi:hypothetical protein